VYDKVGSAALDASTRGCPAFTTCKLSSPLALLCISVYEPLCSCWRILLIGPILKAVTQLISLVTVVKECRLRHCNDVLLVHRMYSINQLPGNCCVLKDHTHNRFLEECFLVAPLDVRDCAEYCQHPLWPARPLVCEFSSKPTPTCFPIPQSFFSASLLSKI
jgi:hypothetical protein